MCVCVFVCVYICVYVCVCICVYVCVYVSVCEFFACICLQPDFIIVINKASHAIDIRWRFLTAHHVNNNIFITFKPIF